MANELLVGFWQGYQNEFAAPVATIEPAVVIALSHDFL